MESKPCTSTPLCSGFDLIFPGRAGSRPLRGTCGHLAGRPPAPGPPGHAQPYLHVYRSLPFLRMGSDSVGGGDRKLKGWWGRGCRELPASAFMAAKLSSLSVMVSMADICRQVRGRDGGPPELLPLLSSVDASPGDRAHPQLGQDKRLVRALRLWVERAVSGLLGHCGQPCRSSFPGSPVSAQGPGRGSLSARQGHTVGQAPALQ